MPANISGIISFSELCEDTKIVDDANILLFSNHCRFLPGNDLSAAVILDFRGVNLGIAAKGNGFGCSGCSGNEVRVRFKFLLRQRGMVSPVYALLRASILDFMLRIENRCRGCRVK